MDTDNRKILDPESWLKASKDYLDAITELNADKNTCQALSDMCLEIANKLKENPKFNPQSFVQKKMKEIYHIYKNQQNT